MDDGKENQLSSQINAEQNRELVFQVEGLDCADCALHVEEALRRTPGIGQVSLDFGLARLRVAPVDGQEIRPEVERVVRELGYGLRDEAAPPQEAGWRERLWRRRRDLATALSGLLIALAVAASLGGLPQGAVVGLYLAAILAGGLFVARAGWSTLRTAR